MSQSAFIYFAPTSAVSSLSPEELKEKLLYYLDQLTKTAQQLNWDCADAGFPYTIETKQEAKDQWFYLKGTNFLYKHIVFGVGREQADGEDRSFVQIVLPDDCTPGDKSKGNEFGKFLARHLKAQLKLFNGRTMHFQPRK